MKIIRRKYKCASCGHGDSWHRVYEKNGLGRDVQGCLAVSKLSGCICGCRKFKRKP